MAHGFSDDSSDDVFTNMQMFERPESEKKLTKKQISHTKITQIIRQSNNDNKNDNINKKVQINGLAPEENDTFWFTDTNDCRIIQMNKEGLALNVYQNYERFRYPIKVIRLPNSDVLATLERNPNNVVRIIKNGKTFLEFGRRFIVNPKDMCVDADGNIIVLESRLMAVYIFAFDGRLLSRFTTTNIFEYPYSIACNDWKELFICDNKKHCIQIYTYDGSRIDTLSNDIIKYPIYAAIGPKNTIIVCDNHKKFNVTVLTRSGDALLRMESTIKIHECLAICMDKKMNFIVADNEGAIYEFQTRHLIIDAIDSLQSNPSDARHAGNPVEDKSCCVYEEYYNSLAKPFHSDRKPKFHPGQSNPIRQIRGAEASQYVKVEFRKPEYPSLSNINGPQMDVQIPNQNFNIPIQSYLGPVLNEILHPSFPTTESPAQQLDLERQQPGYVGSMNPAHPQLDQHSQGRNYLRIINRETSNNNDMQMQLLQRQSRNSRLNADLREFEDKDNSDDDSISLSRQSIIIDIFNYLP